MKINISSPLKRTDIQKMLETQNQPKYAFVKMVSAIEMQFEVSEYEGIGDVAAYTKKLIKDQPWGKGIVFRVLIDGQKFTGDQNY